jgi:hypothetical protein
VKANSSKNSRFHPWALCHLIDEEFEKPLLSKIKQILLVAITLCHLNCNNYESISTCDIRTAALSKHHMLVKLITIDTFLNYRTTSGKKCSFYQAFEVDKNDTLRGKNIRN